MTMPHLENCHHSETGWCLDCVKKQWDEFDDLRAKHFQLRCQYAGAMAQLKIIKSAMREARAFARERGNTLRSFSKRCGVSPSQMSEWTAEPILDPPDLVCRSNDFISGVDDRRQDNA